jgi:hypothetical protein
MITADILIEWISLPMAVYPLLRLVGIIYFLSADVINNFCRHNSPLLTKGLGISKLTRLLFRHR